LTAKRTALTEARAAPSLVAALLVALLGLCFSAQADAAGGGADIASAPTVVFGQHEFGNTNKGVYGSCPDAAEYWLVSLRAGDQATIDWETTDSDYAGGLRVFPAGTTDFSLNNTNPLQYFSLGSNNHAESVFNVGSSGVYPIVFIGDCEGSGGPYDFTATVQHALVPTLKNYVHIKTTTTVTATVSLADGSPVPDGLGFALTVSWSGKESVTYTATTAAGALAFPLALPETALGKTATLIITRPADGAYQEATSAKLEVKVGRGTTPTTKRSPCEIEEARLATLKRQYKRLKYHSLLAHGAQRRRLKNHARRVHRALKFVRGEAAKACGTA
jgi:hypothetical protein